MDNLKFWQLSTLALGLTLIIIIGAWFYTQSSQPTVQPTPQLVPAVTLSPSPISIPLLPTASPTPIDETVNWKMYANPELLFSIKHPQNLTPSVSGNDVIFSQTAQQRAFLLITIILDGNPNGLSAEEWYYDEQQLQFRGGLDPSVKISPLTISSLSGIRLDKVDSLIEYEDFKAIFTDDNVVAILNFGPTKDQLLLANQILSTFKFPD